MEGLEFRKWLVCLLLVAVVCLSHVQGQACPAVSIPTGQDVLNNRASRLRTTVPTRYLMEGFGGASCQGRIEEWTFRADGASCQTGFFEVWRLDGGATYRLVGQNELPGGLCGAIGGVSRVVRYRVPVDEQIYVGRDYVIGWRQTSVGGIGMIHVDYVAVQGNYRTTTNLGCTTCPFVANTNADISLQARLKIGHPVMIDNLPTAVTLLETFNPGTVKTLTSSFTHGYPNAIADPANDGATLIWRPMTTETATFNFITTTGEVRTITTLNFDVRENYTLSFNASDGALNDTRQLTVHVRDVNRPHTVVMAPAGPVTISARTAAVGHVVSTAVPTDPDVKNPTKKVFTLRSITPKSRVFSVNRDTGEVTVATDLLKLTSTASPQRYSLVVTTSDNQNSVDSTLDININGMRRPPVWVPQPNPVRVAENVARGAEIFKATVVADAARTSLRYEIVSITPPEGWDKFTIEPDTGSVRIPPVSGTDPVFDNYKQSTYDIVLKAYDDLYESPDDTVNIQITWVNRNPEFQAPKVYEATIDEELPTDTTVLTLVATDRDTGPPQSQTLLYSILPNHASRYFKICPGPPNNVICIAQIIDVDPPANKWLHNLTFSVNVNDGPAGGTDRADVRVLVRDINDNRPIFNPTAYSAEVNENSRGETPLTNDTVLQATDADSDLNGAIEYSLRNVSAYPDMTMYFQVDPAGGRVTVKHPMDFEQYRLPGNFLGYVDLSFEGVASDLGTPSLESIPVATVNVRLFDVNDNRPVFRQSFFNLEIRADILIGYHVITVTADDADTIPTVSYVTYFLLIPVADFSLNANNGSVTVGKRLTEEYKYILYCYARDNGEPELFSDPSIVRIDSYSPWRYLVDITIDMPSTSFDLPAQARFLAALNTMLSPWVVKIERTTRDKDKTTVTIYALHDNSTDDVMNIDKPKHFVWRDDLLGRLRVDIIGTPNDELKDVLKEFNPINVQPTYPIWIIDTIPGLVTLSVSIFLGLLLILLLSLLVCWKLKVCCFKPKPELAKPVSVGQVNPSYDSSVVEYKKTPPDPRQARATLDDGQDVRSRGGGRRPPSAATIHSLIYVPHK